jgi:DinB superfamily
MRRKNLRLGASSSRRTCLRKQRLAAVSRATCDLALASWAQTAQPATTLTPEERELVWRLSEASRDNFLKSIATLSPKQWTFTPAPDRWSVAETAEHITLSETMIFGLVEPAMQAPATPEKRDQVKGKDQLILTRVPDRSHTRRRLGRFGALPGVGQPRLTE